MERLDDILRSVCQCFGIQGTYAGKQEIKNGNINRTFRVDFDETDGHRHSYIAQRVNTYVFKKPEQVMSNIDRVTEHIRQKRPEAVNLHFHHTQDRKNYLVTEDGFWRLFNYVPSVTYDTCNDLQVVRGAGEAFGDFQTQLADFPAAELYETIPNFHNTVDRFEKLDNAAQTASPERLEKAKEVLEWLNQVRDMACQIETMRERGELPLRVTHNDTKINNVLFDAVDHHPVVVIDLDTVMPGLVACDFGDAIRFAANAVEEDCPRAEEAKLRLDVYEAFAEGFLSRTVKSLTEREVETLPLGCFVMTTELVVRFLDDYLRGDPYFKILYPEHNLVRTRCQMALARDMLAHMDDMQRITRSCAARYQG